jgi:peptidoglycan/xylan/chitin deacetylase (PgdA/CDA1 family)
MLLSPPASSVRINLTFHGVGRPSRPLAPGEDVVWVSVEQFTAVLEAVRTRPEVRITFDDSNRSDLEIALPALRERGLTATFFVLAGALEDPAHLSADDVRTLAAEGMSIGTHGMDHADWRDADDDTLERELGTARQRLEAICRRDVRAAAIPFGHYDRRVLAALRAYGYTQAHTSDGGPARAGAWLQPRNSLRRTDGPAELARMLAPERSAAALATRRAKTALKRWR